MAEKWPDENTRKLLAQQAVQDDDKFGRLTAMMTLDEKWPDENTLELLESQVASFEDDWLRSEIEMSIESLRAKLASD